MIQTKLINVIEQEYGTRPEGSEGNEGCKKSHANVNHDRIAGNSDSAISQGDKAQRINEIELNEKHMPSIEPSEGSDPSGQVIEESSTREQQKLPDSIYRLGHSDKWACKYCNLRDDKWGMIKHYCKGGVH